MLRFLRHLLLAGLMLLPLAVSATPTTPTFPFAYFPNSGNGVVKILNLGTGQDAGSTLQAGWKASATAVPTASALVWGNGLGVVVADNGMDSLSFFSLTHNGVPSSQPTASVLLPGQPYRLAMLPDSSRIVVTFSDIHAVALVDNTVYIPQPGITSNTSGAPWTLTGQNLISPSPSPNWPPKITLIQLDPNFNAGEVVVSDDGNFAYIASTNVPYPVANKNVGEIVSINLRTLQLTHIWNIEGIGTSLALSHDGNNLYVAIPSPKANSNPNVVQYGEVVPIGTSTASGNIPSGSTLAGTNIGPSALVVNGTRLYGVTSGNGVTAGGLVYWDLTNYGAAPVALSQLASPQVNSQCNTDPATITSGTAMSVNYFGALQTTVTPDSAYLQIVVQTDDKGTYQCAWAPNNPTNLNAPPVFGTFLGPYPPSYVFASSNNLTFENISPANVTVWRLGDTTTTGLNAPEFAVNWATYNLSNHTGYAHAGIHYIASAGQLNFPYGSVTPYLNEIPAIPIVHLKWSGPALSFGVELISSAVNGVPATASATLGLQSTTQVGIQYSNTTDPTAAGGCSLARRGGLFDPLLPLLIAAAAFLVRKKPA